MAAMLPGIKKQPFRPRGQKTALPPLLHRTNARAYRSFSRRKPSRDTDANAVPPRPRNATTAPSTAGLAPSPARFGQPCAIPCSSSVSSIIHASNALCKWKMRVFRRLSPGFAQKPRNQASSTKNIGKMPTGVLTGAHGCGLMYIVLRFRISKPVTSIRGLELVNLPTPWRNLLWTLVRSCACCASSGD